MKGINLMSMYFAHTRRERYIPHSVNKPREHTSEYYKYMDEFVHSVISSNAC